MKNISFNTLIICLILGFITNINAQTAPPPNKCETEIVLPDAFAGEEYSENIAKTLNGKKITSTGNKKPDLRWQVGKINLPKGMNLSDDGELSGKPKSDEKNNYELEIKVYDNNNEEAAPFCFRVKFNVKKPEIKLQTSENSPKPENSIIGGKLNVDSDGKVTQTEKAKFGSDTELITVLKNLVSDTNANEATKIFAINKLGELGNKSVGAVDALIKRITEPGVTDTEKTSLNNALAKIMGESVEPKFPAITGKIVDENSNPVEQAKVTLSDKSGNVKVNSYTNEKGEYSLTGVEKGAYELSTSNEYFKNGLTKNVDFQGKNTELPPILMKDKQDGEQGQYTRAVLGYEQSASSSSAANRNFFLDFHFNTPFPFGKGGRHNKIFGPRLRLWTNLRIASAPNPGLDEKSLSVFVTEFNKNSSDTKVKNLIQTFETITGFEYRLTNPRFPVRSDEAGMRNRFSLSFIAGGGIVSPIEPIRSAENRVFEVTSEAIARYPQAKDKKFIAFTTPDRDRYFRQYFAGFRFKTFYYNASSRPFDRTPATFDITFGQNEAVTGGKLTGRILKVEGFFPLPIKNFGGNLFFFGTAQMNLKRATETTPLILKSVSNIDNANLFDANTTIVTLPTFNRDHYRIGFGINPIGVIQYIFRSTDKKDQ